MPGSINKSFLEKLKQMDTAQNQDKLLAQQKKLEAQEAKRALRDQQRAQLNEVFENEKAVIDITMADQKDTVDVTPQDADYAAGNQMDFKQQMKQVKREFRNEKKEMR